MQVKIRPITPPKTTIRIDCPDRSLRFTVPTPDPRDVDLNELVRAMMQDQCPF